MNQLSTELQLFLNFAKVNAILQRRFDAGLGGLSLNEFMILQQLSQASEQKLRRIDLAAKIGLTASGVTRLLAPMEKIGLVKKEENAEDARVRFVVLAAGGKKKLTHALENAEFLAQEILGIDQEKKIETFLAFLKALSGKI